MNMVVVFGTFAKRYSILFQKINLLDIIVFKIFEKYQQLYSYLVKLQALELVTLFSMNTLMCFYGFDYNFTNIFYQMALVALSAGTLKFRNEVVCV